MDDEVRNTEDTRSIAELIEAALEGQIREAANPDSEPDPENFEAIAILHHKGTHEILDAARVLCASLDPERRVLGARILGQLGSPRSFPDECCDDLLKLLNDDNFEVLKAAVYALGHLSNRRADSHLIAFKNHGDDQLRCGVARALCGTTEPHAVGVLIELMDDSYFMTRDWATTGVGQTESLDGLEIREALLRRMSDTDEIVRAEALKGLAMKRDSRGIPFLISELQAESEREDYFCEAAKIHLGLDEDKRFPTEALIDALASQFRLT